MILKSFTNNRKPKLIWPILMAYQQSFTTAAVNGLPTLLRKSNLSRPRWVVEVRIIN